MLLLKVGFPTFLLTGASLLVISTSHVFRAPDQSISKRNGSDTVATFIVPQVDISASKVAVSFGSKTQFRESLLNVSLGNTFLLKRDTWSDTVADGRRLYAEILSRRTVPSHFLEKRWLTGYWPEDSRDSAHRVGWGLEGAEGTTPEGFTPKPETPVIAPVGGFPPDVAMPDAPSPGGSSPEGSSPGSSSFDSSDEEDPLINETPEGYERPFEDLHIPQGAANQNWIAYQNLTFANCFGSGKAATYGSYNNYYNVPGRTIIAAYNYSPSYRLKQIYESAGRPLPPDWQNLLPFVSKWSDATWIIWADLSQKAGREPGNLKYIFRHHVITEHTRQIMTRAVNSHLARWPGNRFTPNDDQYMALLGTAHGKGVFNLLTQHPADLGPRDIESITVFMSPPNSGHLLFTLTD